MRMGTESGSEQVTAGTDAGILRLTINRPEKRNAMTWEVIATLRQAVAEAREDPRVRVLVLTGAGDEAFCSGADLGSMHRGVPAGEGGGQATRGVGAGSTRGEGRAGRPVRAAVGAREADDREGPGLGDGGRPGPGARLRPRGGVAPGAVRGAGDERRALALHDHGPAVRSMPPKKALELMLTGRVIDAEEADRLGFVTRLVDHEDLDRAVDELAATLASKPPGSMRLGRDSFYAVADMESGNALAHLRAMLTLTSLTEDADEGMAAFLEKRAPRWQCP